MSEKLVSEMVIYQQSLCDSLGNENEKYISFSEKTNLSSMVSDLDKYLRKLKHLQKEMTILGEQSQNLKKRAQHLQMLRQEEDERFAEDMEKVKKIEQSIKPTGLF